MLRVSCYAQSALKRKAIALLLVEGNMAGARILPKVPHIDLDLLRGKLVDDGYALALVSLEHSDEDLGLR